MRYLLAVVLLGACSCKAPAPMPPTASEGVSLALRRTSWVDVVCATNSSGGSVVNLGNNLGITAKHVVDPWDSSCTLTLKRPNGETQEAFLLEHYPHSDLALLLIPGEDMAWLQYEAPTLGLPIMAVGYPAGELGVTFGHVAGLPEENDGDVRFTAPIDGGSSGGGVWTVDGQRLVGIAVSRYTNRQLWYNMVPAAKIKDSRLLP